MLKYKIQIPFYQNKFPKKKLIYRHTMQPNILTCIYWEFKNKIYVKNIRKNS